MDINNDLSTFRKIILSNVFSVIERFVMKNIYEQTKKLSGIIIILSILMVTAQSCEESSINDKPNDTSYLQVPEDFPPPPFPDDNPYSDAKFELGRMLYYDQLLTANQEMKSCSHCLKQEHAFSDNVAQSRNFMFEPEDRTTMTLANVVYRDKLFWDGRGYRIEQPAYRSMFLLPIFASDTNDIADRLQNHAIYPDMFKKAFGNDVEPGAWLASQAISTFVRCFISGNSAYDKYIRGDKSAMNESAIRGMDIFFSERARCSVCHSGFMFTDLDFHNTGVNTHYFDFGRFYITNRDEDFGRFLTPSLRNVEVTSPYTHDGELYTLEEVIHNYDLGGNYFYNKDTLMRPLNLTKQESADLIEFLKSLTDHEFLNDERFKDPHK